MSSTKNPFLTFRDIETKSLVGINIHHITIYIDMENYNIGPHVLVFCGDYKSSRKIDISIEEFEAKLRDWYGRNV